MIVALSEGIGTDQLLSAPKFRQSFALLLESRMYANRTLTNGWDFAVNIHEFRQLGLSENDLRLLLRLSYLRHAFETTAVGAVARQFRAKDTISFSERSCFVLTETGFKSFVRHTNSLPKDSCHNGSLVDPLPDSLPLQMPTVPVWDKGIRVLEVNGTIVRRFRRYAMNQELVLTAFQEDKWPSRILDPLPPTASADSRHRLSDTIKFLNRGLTGNLLRFRGDGTGEGVTWERVS